MEQGAYKGLQRFLFISWGCIGLIVLGLITAGVIGLLILVGVLCLCP